jgi:hypothetical protein
LRIDVGGSLPVLAWLQDLWETFDSESCTAAAVLMRNRRVFENAQRRAIPSALLDRCVESSGSGVQRSARSGKWGAGIALATAREHAGPSFESSCGSGYFGCNGLVAPAVRKVREIFSVIVDSREAVAAVA